MDIRHLTGRIDPNSVPQQKGPQEVPGKTAEGLKFSDLLERKQKIEFSGHAKDRLESRSISMNTADMRRLEEAVSRAEAKGSTDSLVIDGDRAFLVNIPNKKVVTAVDMMELRDKVFTNIDSTVLTKQNI